VQKPEGVSTVKKTKLERKPLHIDRWAGDIVKAAKGRDDRFLTVNEMADWLRVSAQWLNNLRSTENGPPFVTLPDLSVRYPMRQAKEWLADRMHSSTKEYPTHGGRPRKLAEA
jgi:hypothetical protein